MSHLKRKSMEKSWPLPRKGTKYVLIAYPGKKSEMSMPLGIILRDVLNATSKRKETKALLHNKEVKVNGKIAEEEKLPVGLFDILSIPKLGKNYTIVFNESGKISCEEINEKDSNLKICKIIGQKILKKGIKQINCIDGRNFLSKEKMSINDSIVLDLKDNKIIKILPFKAGSEALIIGGAHIGEKGKITEIEKDKVKISLKSKTFEIQERNVVVVK